MTITADYAPEEYDLNDDRVYRFTFPAADDASVEVYEIILLEGTEYQYLVPFQDYSLIWGSGNSRYPLKTSGEVTFSRLHSVGAVRVMFARNTLIDQTCDFKKFSSFNSRAVEFELDKRTMIFQEIAQRKCNAVVTTPMTQPVVYGAYDDFKASVVNWSIARLFAIAAEIDASADDCTDNLGGT